MLVENCCDEFYLIIVYTLITFKKKTNVFFFLIDNCLLPYFFRLSLKVYRVFECYDLSVLSDLQW